MHRTHPVPAPGPQHPRARAQDGFSLIEVLVTVLVLSVGLIGAFAALRAAARTTLTNRERQAEVALAREVISDASSLPYAQLNTSALPAALQPLVPNSTTTSGGLQVTRGPSGYSVTVTGCSIDDPSDGLGNHTPAPASGGTWCAGQTSGTADTHPDDEKLVSVTVQTTTDTAGPTVYQTVLIPSNGLPAVTCLTVSGGACPDANQTAVHSTSLTFSVTTTSQASQLAWFVNGDISGTYAPSGTTSTFTWQVPQSPGNYTISVQSQDSQGDTGPLSSLQVTVS